MEMHTEQGMDQGGAQSSARREQQLGVALGWFSVGLGLANLLAPRAMARTTGLPDWPLLMRMMGARRPVSRPAPRLVPCPVPCAFP